MFTSWSKDEVYIQVLGMHISFLCWWHLTSVAKPQKLQFSNTSHLVLHTPVHSGSRDQILVHTKNNDILCQVQCVQNFTFHNVFVKHHTILHPDHYEQFHDNTFVLTAYSSLISNISYQKHNPVKIKPTLTARCNSICTKPIILVQVQFNFNTIRFREYVNTFKASEVAKFLKILHLHALL